FTAPVPPPPVPPPPVPPPVPPPGLLLLPPPQAVQKMEETSNTKANVGFDIRSPTRDRQPKCKCMMRLATRKVADGRHIPRTSGDGSGTALLRAQPGPRGMPQTMPPNKMHHFFRQVLGVIPRAFECLGDQQDFEAVGTP